MRAYGPLRTASRRRRSARPVRVRTHRKARLMKSPQATDVLITGAGPSGSALANDLVRHGLGVRVVGRSPHAFGGWRGKGIQPRSLEVVEDLGALDDVLAGGDIYPKRGIHAGPIGVAWKMFPHREATPDVPYPNTWLI